MSDQSQWWNRIVCRWPQETTLGCLDNEPAVTSSLPISSKFPFPWHRWLPPSLQEGSQLPMDTQGVQTQAAGSQIILDSWHLHSLIASGLHEPHWQECLQLWSGRKEDVPSSECSLMTCPTEHLAPVWPLSIPSLADSWLVKFLLKPVPVYDVVNLPELCCTTTYSLNCFPDDERSLCLPWSHHCDLSREQNV